MTFEQLTARADAYLHQLCAEISPRPVGSAGNRAATEFFAQAVTQYGFQTVCPEFECLDWVSGGAQLTAAGVPFPVWVSPFSLSVRAQAPLVVASSVDELAALDAGHKIVLLRGELTTEQLMPKNFPFYNPEHHQRIIHWLETKAPAALSAATSRNPELAGGLYPFPLIEDGDFDIPSVYMKAEDGDLLAGYAGQEVTLDIRSQRLPARGSNVIARKQDAADRRVVVCAHIDAKPDTPGALDNATGVVVLLLLAELLAAYHGGLGVELVAFNGEDYYSAPGQQLYLRENAGKMDSIRLVINLDLAGYREGKTVYSLYNPPALIVSTVNHVFTSDKHISEGQPWFQGDHSIFIQQGVPALAITSDRFLWLSTHITHTPQDLPELVEPSKLVHIAQALHALLLGLEQELA